MHGLVNKSLESFVRDFYGDGTWGTVVLTADTGVDQFEAMLHYPDDVTERLLCAAASHLEKPRESVLEDLGNYLVSHPNSSALRRLMRLSGKTFQEFVQSIDLLPERSRLAISDLDVPSIALTDHGGGQFSLRVSGLTHGIGRVLGGILRAMADDYGALITLDYGPMAEAGGERIDLAVHEFSFAEGRVFHLVDGGGV